MTGKSIINQVVRNSVIMGEELVKAYGPYVEVARNVALKYVELVRTQLPQIIENWEKIVKKVCFSFFLFSSFEIRKIN